jgi:hypothetical protein
MISFSKPAVNILATMHGNLAAIFFQSVSPSVGIPSSDLRHRVALYMRDNEEIWRTWRFMEDISATAIWLVHVAFMSKAMQKLLPHQTLFRGTF